MILRLKASLVWLLIAVLAVINGVFRESILNPSLGEHLALPMSGITLSIMIVIVTYAVFDWLKARTQKQCIGIGIQWALMTLLFEFLFGHYVAQKPWSEILHVFNVLSGDLFLLVILTLLLSPCFIAKCKAET